MKEWLNRQDAYTSHKPVRRKFKRSPIISGGTAHQYQADVINLRNFTHKKKQKPGNDDYSYMVKCFDLFNKWTWAITIKTKTDVALIRAMTDIFKERQPISLQTDKGLEFVNLIFQKYLRDHNINFFPAENEDIKVAVVAHFNCTLKEKMWRYFTKYNKLWYIGMLAELVRNYNY